LNEPWVSYKLLTGGRIDAIAAKVNDWKLYDCTRANQFGLPWYNS